MAQSSQTQPGCSVSHRHTTVSELTSSNNVFLQLCLSEFEFNRFLCRIPTVESLFHLTYCSLHHKYIWLFIIQQALELTNLPLKPAPARGSGALQLDEVCHGPYQSQTHEKNQQTSDLEQFNNISRVFGINVLNRMQAKVQRSNIKGLKFNLGHLFVSLMAIQTKQTNDS